MALKVNDEANEARQLLYQEGAYVCVFVRRARVCVYY